MVGSPAFRVRAIWWFLYNITNCLHAYPRLLLRHCCKHRTLAAMAVSVLRHTTVAKRAPNELEVRRVIESIYVATLLSKNFLV